MKRFIIFAGSNYYPEKGLENYISSFDELGVAKEKLFALSKDKRFVERVAVDPADIWIQLWDQKEIKLVFDYNSLHKG